MRRLTALGAAWLILVGLASAALAQGLPDVRLGNEAFRQGDYAAAVGHYTDAIRSGELVGEALAITYNNRGVAHGEAGDFDPAIADYSQALALRPGDATTIRNLRVAHVRRGEVSFASGAYDDAIADFTLAAELEADHHLAYQRRGELYAELGLLDLAVEDLERAALLSPGDPEIVAALERATERRDSVVASVEGATPAVDEPMPMAGVAAAPEPETPVAELPEPARAAEEVTEKAAEAPEAAEPAEAPVAEPTIGARPEPAPRVAAVAPPAAEAPAAEASTPEAPAPETPAPEAAAPAAPVAEPASPVASPATEPEREIEITPAVPTPAEVTPAPAPAPTQTAAADGEPYRVISAVNYRAGPDNDAPRIGTVDAGRVVRVTGDTLGWKHVSLPNGDSGFIYQTWLEPVTE